MRVGITGPGGFLAWHVRCRLASREIDCATAGRDVFGDAERLRAFVSDCDVVLHLAGVNRAETDEAVRSGNVDLAMLLVQALNDLGDGAGSKTVVFANSTQSEGSGTYGQAKASASAMLSTWAQESEGHLVDLVLPHLFGEYGRPHYNSAITTFAHCLATGSQPSVDPDGRLELLHAQDVAARISAVIDAVENGDTTGSVVRERLRGRQISVGEVWELLRSQHERYVTEFTVPSFADDFELRIFNLLRSQLHLAGFYPQSLVRHADARGAFVEVNRSDGLGQCSISTSVPGITRGDHYHFDKVERFVVVGGQARIRLRRLFCEDVEVFDVVGDEPCFIDMPPLVTHNITNTGDSELITLFWAADHFDPARPDTFVEPVESDEGAV